ncbi:alpha/beta hydrolase [Streptomyces sp. NPDC013178]|uniref:alpha/beta hydrolase n=1 Tax=Streptomyces sp. NPDC013178 TaxID=3155118 RepID=UPI0033CB0913
MKLDDQDRFTYTVTSSGPAQGMKFAGRGRVDAATPASSDIPLVIAIHGGGYTSEYFDIPGYSLLDRASRLQIPIIAIDRPGYGGSDASSSDAAVLLTNAELLDHVIGDLWKEHGTGTSGVVLIGHSIGGAVALALAARGPAWPLLGVAVSGCLLREPEHFHDAWAAFPGTSMHPSDEQRAFLMFGGPEWTLRGDMPSRSTVAHAPVLVSELIEISGSWEETFRRELAPAISVPVHLRQGEFEQLWITNDAEVAEFAAELTSSPFVDAEVFQSAGHAIDFHRGGAAFQVQQLAFALDCCARRIKEQ